MSVTSLLAELKAKGIEVRLEDGKPKLRGPQAALTEALVAELREHKAEIIAALSQQPTPTEPTPARPCYACGGIRFWQRPDGGWVCAACHPAPIEDVPEVTVLRNLRDSLAHAIFELAEAAGWPTVALDGHRTVIGTRTAWVAFSRTANVPTLKLAISKLKEVVE